MYQEICLCIQLECLWQISQRAPDVILNHQLKLAKREGWIDGFICALALSLAIVVYWSTL